MTKRKRDDRILFLRQTHRLRAPLARDHRRAQQELPRALGVGRARVQLVEIALAYRRIARLQSLLVGDRLLLNEFDCHGAALQIVEIEEPLRRAIAHDANNLVGEIHGVLDAAV